MNQDYRLNKRLNVQLKTGLGLMAVVGFLAGCGLKTDDILPDRRVDYKKATSIPTLEVPPDLSSAGLNDTLSVPNLGSASYADYQQQRAATDPAVSGVLPRSAEVRLERSGTQRWLVVSASAEEIWPKLRAFWLEQGFNLKIEDARIGILETEWQENRADIPQDRLRSLLQKSLGENAYSAPTRDKYRIRLERSPDGKASEIYLSHRGMLETDRGTTGVVWAPRPTDPELEAEFLNRLIIHLGKSAPANAAAGTQAQATLNKDADGFGVLQIQLPVAEAWRVVGLTLDRVSFTVEERKADQQVYLVRYQDPDQEAPKRGLLSGLAFWRSDRKSEAQRYQISVQGDARSSTVKVLTLEGTHDNSATANRILTLLQEQLR